MTERVSYWLKTISSQKKLNPRDFGYFYENLVHTNFEQNIYSISSLIRLILFKIHGLYSFKFKIMINNIRADDYDLYEILTINRCSEIPEQMCLHFLVSLVMRNCVFGSLRPGKTQTDLLSYRDQLES